MKAYRSVSLSLFANRLEPILTTIFFFLGTSVSDIFLI
jgi:hypothetical protein